MIEAVSLAKPDLILCPYLTKLVPREVYTEHLTLIIHPGPPGDAGPSAIDLALIGDTGELEAWEEQKIIVDVRHSKHEPHAMKGRSHWAVTCLQAIEEFDAGPVCESRIYIHHRRHRHRG